LAFLTQAAEKRAALLDADEKRQRIAEERRPPNGPVWKPNAPAGKPKWPGRRRWKKPARRRPPPPRRWRESGPGRTDARLAGAIAPALSEERRVNANANQEAWSARISFAGKSTIRISRRRRRSTVRQPGFFIDRPSRRLHEALQNLSKPTRVTPFKPELNLDAPRMFLRRRPRHPGRDHSRNRLEIRQLSTEEKDSRWNNTQELRRT
jgi:hypothetical protein